MQNFMFHLRTKLYFGQDEHLKIGEIISEHNFHNVLILIGKNHVKQSGLLEEITTRLSAKQITFKIYEGITPNPEVKYAREAREIAREMKSDLLLAIGGGSVIDIAKLVSASYYYEGDPFDFCDKTVAVQKTLPVGVILTHSSAGSEMSASAVISDSAVLFKEGFRSELLRPLFAITNPSLTLSLSRYQTAVGIADSFMHSLERYFSGDEELLLADRFNEAVFITLKEAATKIIENYSDYEARANIMLASTMSHTGLGGLGKETYMSAHQLEHAVSALYPNVAHGHGLAIIWPAWSRVYLPRMVNKFDRFARTVFNLHNNDKMKNGLLGIEALEKLFKDLGLTMSLRSVGVETSDLDKLVSIVTQNGKNKLYHRLYPLNEKEIRAIYEACL